MSFEEIVYRRTDGWTMDKMWSQKLTLSQVSWKNQKSSENFTRHAKH